MTTDQQFDSHELLRYVRLRRPSLIDLRLRSEQDKDLRKVLRASKKSQRSWAKDITARMTLDKSALDERLILLKKQTLSEEHLPSASDFDENCQTAIGKLIPSDQHQQLCAKTLKLTLAHKILNHNKDSQYYAHLLQFLEQLHELPKHSTREPYAQAVLTRYTANVKEQLVSKENNQKNRTDVIEQHQALDTIHQSFRSIWKMWLKTDKQTKSSLALQAQDLKQRKFTLRSKLAKIDSANVIYKSEQPIKSAQNEVEEARESIKQDIETLKTQREEIVKTRLMLSRQSETNTLADLVKNNPDHINTAIAKFDLGDIAQYLKTLSEALNIRNIDEYSLCDIYEKIIAAQNNNHAVDNPAVPASSPGAESDCFLENPNITFEDQIRPLGYGMLIKVEEKFIKYSEGEIQYVENILAGETRRREYKSTRYAESITETESFEESEDSTENSVRLGDSLRTSIESEINTSFNSDINAQASGSGGGTIGVVDFDGSTSLEAGVGIGVDTRFVSRSESEFSREIINKALEKNKSSIRKLQRERSYNLYESNNSHEIDNTGESPSHRRGIYCFLNKHVCIEETEYGTRLFLLGNVLLPGKNLLCAEQERKILLSQNQGQGQEERPEFNMTPDDIHPWTYKEYVGKYNAANIAPPPDAMQHLASTYKTDQTNTEKGAGGGFNLKKIADALVPFFEQYQRHLITDILEIPEGYELLEVNVAVNHGANGISVPAHLPITLTGATLYSLPQLGAAAINPFIYLPLALWQIAQFASPLMHYNVDSSNVTVCVGTESQDSRYFFFEPAHIIDELSELFQNFSFQNPNLVGQIQTEAATLFDSLRANASNVPAATQDLVKDSIESLVDQLREIFQAIVAAVNPTQGEVVPSFNPVNGELTEIVKKIAGLTKDFVGTATNLSNVMGDFFTPVDTFFKNIFALIGNALDFSLPEVLADLLAEFNNSEVLRFGNAFGSRQQVPVSLNVVSIKPGITINLTACVGRTEEAMEKWRLETFTTLHQAYLQQLAEYESRHYGSQTGGLTKSSTVLREEESRSLKEIMLNTLNNYHGNQQSHYSLNRINLFEHGIDWKNMSYRLYNYGPKKSDIEMENLGLLNGVDARRRAFLSAHWAQVLLPLPENPHLEKQLLLYFKNGTTDLEGELDDDELAALYQNLIQQRDLSKENPQQTHRREILPTDFVVLKTDDNLPMNNTLDSECH